MKTICIILAVLLLTTSATASVTFAPATIEVPVSVYRYTFNAVPDMDATLDDAAIVALFDAANEIWRPAGIRWVPSPVEDRVISWCQVDGSSVDHAQFRSDMLAVAPIKAWWSVVFVGEFPVSAAGVYLPEAGTAIVSEWSRGHPTSPVILAHELGHSLGLGHSTATWNLMHGKAGAWGQITEGASGLTSRQIRIARAQAKIGPINATKKGGAL